MADKVTYHVEVNDYTKGGAIVGTLTLEIGSRDGSVFIRLVDGDSNTLAGLMTAPQARAMVKGLQQAIPNIGQPTNAGIQPLPDSPGLASTHGEKTSWRWPRQERQRSGLGHAVLMNNPLKSQLSSTWRSPRARTPPGLIRTIF